MHVLYSFALNAVYFQSSFPMLAALNRRKMVIAQSVQKCLQVEPLAMKVLLYIGLPSHVSIVSDYLMLT